MAIVDGRTYGPGLDTTTSATCSYTLGVGEHVDVGETLLIGCGEAGASGCVAQSASDTKGNTYSVDVGLAASGGISASNVSSRITTALVAGDIITVTFSKTTATDKAIRLHTVAGMAVVSAVDQVASAGIAGAGSTTPAASTSPASTDTANEYVFATVVWNQNATKTDDPAYTTYAKFHFDNVGAGQTKQMSIAGKIVSATGVQAISETLSGSNQWAVVLSTYRILPSGGGGGGGGGGAVKAVPRGLATRDAAKPPNGYDGSFTHRMRRIYWDQIQPNDVNSLQASGGSDSIAAITADLDAAQAAGDTMGFRLFCGYRSPTWLESKVGTFKYKDPATATNPIVDVPRYWLPAYLADFQRFLTLLGAAFDGHPALRMVQLSNAMTFFAEELIKHVSAAANRASMVGGGNGWDGAPIAVPGAGYSDAANMAAIKAGIDYHDVAFPNTPASISFNPYSKLLSEAEAGKTYANDNQTYSGSDDANITKTKEVIDYMIAKLGGSQRVVLENNSVASDFFNADKSLKPSKLQQMYDYFKSRARPIYIQCANDTQIGDFPFAMQCIVDTLQANACEPTHNSGNTPYTAGELSGWDTLLKARAVPTGNTNHVPFGTADPTIAVPAAGYIATTVLTGNAGSWDGGGQGIAHVNIQWFRQDPVTGARTSVRGPTAFTNPAATDPYTLQPGDVGKVIVLVATADNASGTSPTQESAPTPIIQAAVIPVPTNLVSPVLDVLAPTLDDVEHATAGTWSDGPTAFQYQFERSSDGGANWSVVQVGVGAAYQLGTSDVGQIIRVGVIANNGRDSAIAYSAATAAVKSAPVFALTQPTADSTFVTGSTYSIIGQVLPRGAAVTSLTVNGQAVTFDSAGNFTYVAAGLVSGTNDYRLVATDATGGQVVKLLHLVADVFQVSSDVGLIELRIHQHGLGEL